MIEKYKNILFNLVPDISLAMIILLGFIIGGIIIKSIITSKLLKQKGNPALIKLIGNAVKNIFIILGIISAFGTLGIDVSAMIAGLGLTGFALGFALKDILSNVISGVLILIYQPFKINNFITVDKYEGSVIDINLRYTTIMQENKEILIPNSFLFAKPISVNKQSN
tara:strand:+ start:269 stop:769 length:501 start_codon:yes stop_codon:yes gene_type:complete